MLLLLTVAATTSLATTVLPNIVWIMADDLGYGDVGSYPNPSPIRLKTPNIDALAQQGLRFSDAYAGYSVCAPSRATLMHGRHSGHFDPYDNGNEPLLTNTSITVTDILKKAGYATAAIGKWGLDGQRSPPKPPTGGFPLVQGFDSYVGQSDQLLCHTYFPAYQYRQDVNETIPQNAHASAAECGPDLDKCAWTGDLWAAEAEQFLQNSNNQRPDNAPFFLYLAFTAPHAGDVGTVAETGVPAPRVSVGPYANETTWPKVERDFATAVFDVDELVGKVLTALDQNGLTNNTLVIFASDNGAHNEGGHSYKFFESSGYLNGFKRSIHDGGHRAAVIARWPGHTPVGVVTAQQFAFYDFLPTVAELVGLPAPPNIDGHSILPTLEGNAQPQPPFIYHDYIQCEDPICSSTMGLNCDFGQNIRMGNWSGVCVGPETPCSGADPGAFFLYDMSTDSAQKHDVSKEHPALVAQLLSIMAQQYNPNFPQPLPFPPMPSPCTAVLEPGYAGNWSAASNTQIYSMTMPAQAGAPVALAVQSCPGCNWVTATGVLKPGVPGKSPTRLVVSATGPHGFQRNLTGTFGADDCTIQWSEAWASWVKLDA